MPIMNVAINKGIKPSPNGAKRIVVCGDTICAAMLKLNAVNRIKSIAFFIFLKKLYIAPHTIINRIFVCLY